MATEKGIVIKIDASKAWVKTSRSSACESCASRKSCHSLSGSTEEMEVEAINEAGAKVGDRIVLSMQTSSFLKATFLLYIFPILLLLVGAAAGHYSAAFFGIDQSAFSAIIGFLLFFLAFGFVKAKGNKLAQKPDYRPKIIRILGHTPPS